MNDKPSDIGQCFTSAQLKQIIKEAIQETILKEKEKVTFTIDECVSYTGIGRDKILELAHSVNGDFPVFRVGKKFLVNRELLDSWLNKISLEKRVL